MNALFSILLILILPEAIIAGASANTVPGEFEATVTWVIDGDSIRFLRADDSTGSKAGKKGVRDPGVRDSDECRMLHYNAPEMTGPERHEGKQAARKLISLIKGRRVLIWGMERDHYGRLLCEVRLMDGTYINDIMRQFLKDYSKRDIFLWKETGQKQRGDK